MDVLVVVLLTFLGTGLGWWMARLDRKIEDTNAIVRRELRPNGGHSVHDRIGAIEARLVDGDHRMRAIEKSVDGTRDKLAEMWAID